MLSLPGSQHVTVELNIIIVSVHCSLAIFLQEQSSQFLVPVACRILNAGLTSILVTKKCAIDMLKNYYSVYNSVHMTENY